MTISVGVFAAALVGTFLVGAACGVVALVNLEETEKGDEEGKEEGDRVVIAVID